MGNDRSAAIQAVRLLSARGAARRGDGERGERDPRAPARTGHRDLGEVGAVGADWSVVLAAVRTRAAAPEARASRAARSPATRSAEAIQEKHSVMQDMKIV